MAGPIEQFYHGRIHEVVELQDDSAFSSGFDVLDFLPNQLRKARARRVRAHNQMLEPRTLVVVGEKTEEVRHFLGDARVGSEVSEVAEHLGPLLVEVAGADVRHTVGGDTLTAGDQKQLGMHLQACNPKSHLNAGFLQDVRHADVVLLVKPRIQFNDCHDLLAVVCCVDEGIDDTRIVGNTVEVNVNRFDRRVDRCFAHQIHHMPEIMVGVIQQNVLAQHLLNQAALTF